MPRDDRHARTHARARACVQWRVWPGATRGRSRAASAARARALACRHPRGRLQALPRPAHRRRRHAGARLGVSVRSARAFLPGPQHMDACMCVSWPPHHRLFDAGSRQPWCAARLVRPPASPSPCRQARWRGAHRRNARSLGTKTPAMCLRRHGTRRGPEPWRTPCASMAAAASWPGWTRGPAPPLGRLRATRGCSNLYSTLIGPEALRSTSSLTPCFVGMPWQRNQGTDFSPRELARHSRRQQPQRPPSSAPC